MKVSLVIPTYNRSDILIEVIQRALAQTYYNFETIIVDQTLKHPAIVEEYISSVSNRLRYIKRSHANLPAARNAGVREATGDIIIFIDDDLVIEPDYISKHALNYEDEEVGSVMGLTLTPVDFNLEEVLRKSEERFQISAPTRLGDKALVTWTNGGNTSYRRKAILEAGMFDEYFGANGWCEDRDMSVRVRSIGYKLILDTKITAIHLELGAGGCENRNPLIIDQMEVMRSFLYFYFLFKNRSLFDWVTIIKKLTVSYRQFVINRRTLRNGPVRFMNRNWVYIETLAKAFVASNKCLASQKTKLHRR
jgi:glycosyltransferase involved in cell wall biosynthesis